MKLLVTGAAGFIGFATARALAKRGTTVIGVDNVNAYYSKNLKMARIAELEKENEFTFCRIDISDFDEITELNARHGPFTHVVHCAAQVGVRYGIDNPFIYAKDNLLGHLNILELCRNTDGFEHLVFASSSSVYGVHSNQRSSTADRIDQPMSLYAATKASDEQISYCYAHLFGLPQTALRFFTVYGPWGRPDMAVYLFTHLIANAEPIKVFNNGDMYRDFTYIDDIVDGVIRALDRPPDNTTGTPFAVYNLGKGESESLGDLISYIENALGRKAIRNNQPLQPGDPIKTLADIVPTMQDLGYVPKVSLAEGIERFVVWYREFHKL